MSVSQVLDYIFFFFLYGLNMFFISSVQFCYISLEIENRWQDDGTKGLPKGVLDSLQKVTPPNGLLTFERFCAGLKICLLRNQAEAGRSKSSDCNSKNITGNLWS